MKGSFLILVLVSFSQNVFSCVAMDTKYEWKHATHVYVGKVISGQLVSKDNNEVVEFVVKHQQTLKGKRIPNNHKVNSRVSFPVLSIGNSFIIFEHAGSLIDYCGPTRYFDIDWLSKAENQVQNEVSKEEWEFINEIRLYASKP